MIANVHFASKYSMKLSNYAVPTYNEISMTCYDIFSRLNAILV